MAISLSGNLSSITARPLSQITNVTVKAPAPRLGPISVISTQPEHVDVAPDGAFSLEVEAGIGWMYLDGDGWSDTLRFVAAEGMTLFWEAVNNATPHGALLNALTAGLKEKLQAAIENLPNDVRWRRGTLTAEAYTLDSLRNYPQQGIWEVQSGATAQALGLPEVSAGMFHMEFVSNNGAVVQDWYPATTGSRWRRQFYNGRWSPWSNHSQGWYRGLIRSGVNLDEYRYEKHIGIWGVSPATRATELGLPFEDTATVEVRWIAGGNTPNTQQVATASSGAQWMRYCGLGSWGPWRPLTGGSDGTVSAQREVRVSRMRQRVGEVRIGDKGAVALICDHGTAKFRDVVYPMLQERGLTCTLALNSLRDQPDYYHAATEGDVTWDEIKAWADAGIEIANHSATHRGAVGLEATQSEIVQARVDLEAKIGREVDSWVQPGTFPAGNYDGFASGATPEAYWDTAAGRMLLSSHPVITGSLSGDYYPVDGVIPVGMKGYWLDTGNISGAKTFTEKARLDKTRCLLRLHPYAVDDKISRSALAEILDDLVAKRDAGELAVLTLREWALADR